MGNILINKFTYSGDIYYYQSQQLSDGLNIIEGENRNGKTTFMDLIYFCLGGSVEQFKFEEKNKIKHIEIINDTNGYVELDIILNDERFFLRRSLGKNYISYTDKHGDTKTLPIYRSKSEVYIFSDWILEKLNIDVVDIYQGTRVFKLNITDLFRLIYHNQVDPKKIYKAPDADNFIADSEEVRQVIFRILLGKTYTEYYKALTKYKQAEREKNSAKDVLNEFKLIAEKLNAEYEESVNAVFLNERIQEKEEQLKKLLSSREKLKIDRPTVSKDSQIRIYGSKNEILQTELDLRQNKEEQRNLLDDKNKYFKYRDNLMKEVTQLNKIIHTHETLSIFSEDTCPYCLRDIKRGDGKCFCGQVIDENEFEKFFYSSDEYWDILKSRKKSVETVENVLETIDKKLKSLIFLQRKMEMKISQLKSSIQETINEIDNNSIDVNKLDIIDDKILELKNDIQILQKKLEIEEKLENYQKKFNKYDEVYNKFKNDAISLESDAKKDMIDVVSSFNNVYNKLMTSALKECKSAKIDFDDYQPIIDEGVYREASSKVSTRFMYYLTLLSLSLSNEEINFPRFLLIDTPQTLGIDPSQLNEIYKQIENIIPENNQRKFQIILSTRTNTYPEHFKKYVFETLKDSYKLLKKK